MGTRLKEQDLGSLGAGREGEGMQYVLLLQPEGHGPVHGNVAVRHLVEQSWCHIYGPDTVPSGDVPAT